MQIFKPFLLACSLAVATGPVCLRADDTDAQAAARAALQQKMREMNGHAPAAAGRAARLRAGPGGFSQSASYSPSQPARNNGSAGNVQP
jgi:hypothetical protein